jgi:hypothetical protein
MEDWIDTLKIWGLSPSFCTIKDLLSNGIPWMGISGERSCRSFLGLTFREGHP